MLLQKACFFTAFIVPALVIAGFHVGGYWNYLAIIFSFVLIPIIDQWIGIDTTNVPETEAKAKGEEFYYRFVTYCWAYFQFAFMVWGAFAIGSGKLASATSWAGFVMSFGMVTGGIGITVAHELGHKRSKLERFYGKLLLMTVSYMHFYIEHNRGHHVHVATPDDPATARKHENFYRFWFRSVFGSYVHAWKLERERLQRKNFSAFGLRNEMIWLGILPLGFCAMLTALVSVPAGRIVWEVVVFFFAQSFVAFTLLELVNYVEHYGIQRRQIAPGRYERVNPVHSWNASHLLSNFFLFQLQRHSDHHAYAHKRYQALNHYNESPQLPFGYPTMILIALTPPLWFALMDRRLEQWQKQSKLEPV